MSTQGIIDGLWRGERKCIDPNAGDVDLWIQVWEELHLLTSKEMLVEVEHVKAHRTKKYKKDMSHFEKFVTENADELAKGAMMDDGFVAEARAKTMQQEREEVYAALQCAASFHCLVEEWKDCAEIKPQPKEKWTFCGQEKGGNKASTGMVCCCQQVPMHEMWKRQQVHEYARKIYRDGGSCQRIWEHGEGDTWEGAIW